MKKNRITQRDIARLAGISNATVSNVLSGNPRSVPLRQDTIDKVMEVARQLNYVPNRLPRLFNKGRSGLISFSMQPLLDMPPQVFEDPYSDQAVFNTLNPVSMTLLLFEEKKYDDWTLLFDFRDPVCKQFDPNRHKMDLVDGIIYSMPHLEADDSLLQIARTGFPIISDVILPTHPDIYCTGGDNVGTGRRAVEHFAGLGHKNIALLLAQPQSWEVSVQRAEGYREGLRTAGLSWEKICYFRQTHQFSVLKQNVSDILDQCQGQATAYIVGSALISRLLIEEGQRRGLQVPGDMAVLSLDEGADSIHSTPPISTLYQPRGFVYRKALDMLIQLIDGEEIEPRQQAIEAKLSVRGSCGAPVE